MTYAQIASTFANWREYFDTGAFMSEEEFDALSNDERIGLLIAAFGPEQQAA